MRDDFDWYGNDVVLGWQPRTAVFGTTACEVEIRQENIGGVFDRDVQVFLTPVGALQVAWRLIEVAHELGLPTPCRELMTGLDTGPLAPAAPTNTASAVDTPSPDSEGVAE